MTPLKKLMIEHTSYNTILGVKRMNKVLLAQLIEVASRSND